MEYNLSDILNGCKQETPAWQKVLYEKYYGYAYSICVRYAPDVEDTIEVLNDGFVKVFKGILKFVEPEDNITLQKVFMSWLKIIMINTGINHSKSAGRKISWSNNEETAKNVTASQPDATENLGYQDLVKLVHKLSPAYRNTFSLYAIDGYTHEEISRILGVSVGTSKSNLLKARKNLRKMLQSVQGEKTWKYEG